MPNNPQDTLGTTPIKFYNQTHCTRVEALEWFRIVHKDGRRLQLLIIPTHNNKELQDYEPLIFMLHLKITLVPQNRNIRHI